MTRMGFGAGTLLSMAVSTAVPITAADLPEASVLLEEPPAARAGIVPEAAPLRFALLTDGQVFVGGSSEVLTTRLSSKELKNFERRVEEIRKHPALAGNVALGPGSGRRRLVLRQGGRPLDMVFTGDPASATPALRALADFVAGLAAFHHPGLRPFAAERLALSAREGALPGGCRSWTRPEPVTDALFAPRVVSAEGFESWPRGAPPAHVCAGGKKYVVTLRPLLPGEQP